MIDCKAYADEILDGIKTKGHLAVISVGDDPASMSYIKGKRKDCERVGHKFTHHAYPADVREEIVLTMIDMLNDDPDVTGIIVQLPLPRHLDAERICDRIVPEKDVDGFVQGSPFKPCTPEGIVYLMKRELGDLRGKCVMIIGRGKLVGKPLMQMLLDEDMTVTVCHSKTRTVNLNQLVSVSDAVIVAIGKPNEVRLYNVSGNTVVIDCGVNRNEDGKLCGDVMFANTKRITPVPGGVGLMTRAMLMRHVEKGAKMDGGVSDENA